jgi:predicted permease
MSHLFSNIRFAVRSLLKTRGFTLVSLATLTLGIGVNTAMFSVVRAVLLAELPYPEPERMTQLWETRPGGHQMQVSGPNFHDWHDRNHSFAALAYGFTEETTIAGGITPRRMTLASVSKQFYSVAGVKPERGRLLNASEHRQGAAAVALISHRVWVNSLGADPGAIGRTIRIGGVPNEIVGVLPQGFDFPNKAEAWVAMERIPDRSTRSAHNFRVWGRLRPEVTVSAAQTDMDLVASQLAREYVDDHDRGIKVISLHEQITGPVRPALLILFAAVGFVLLIACVNIANLQLARGAARVKEMALRTALGAARSRLIAQLLTESILLSLAGGAAGTLLGFWITESFRVIMPSNIPRIEEIQLNALVLGFTLGVSVISGLLFGILPAWSASNTDVNETLKESSGKASWGKRSRRLQSSLVIAEIAFATVLLIGAGLMIQTLWNLNKVDPGFRTSGVITAEVSWPVQSLWPAMDGADTAGQMGRLTARMLDQVRRLPEVEFAGSANTIPIRDHGGADGSFEIAGRPLPLNPHDYPNSDYLVATTGYFEALGIPLVKGRYFSRLDENPNAAQTAIVNEQFLREFFPGQEPIGKRIRFLGFDRNPQFMEIVGVIGDIRSAELTRNPAPEVYASGMQHPDYLASATLTVRGPTSLEPRIREVVRSLSADVPLEFAGMHEVIAASIARQRFQMTLLSAFAGLALLLAAVGVYGLLSYAVDRRTAELGIRMALGADRRKLLGMVLHEGLELAAGGTILGLFGAFAVTRIMAGVLYGVSPTSVHVFAVTSFVLCAASLVACYVPARRAANADPMSALRYE